MRKTVYNTGLAKVAVQYSADTFMPPLNFYVKNPQHTLLKSENKIHQIKKMISLGINTDVK